MIIGNDIGFFRAKSKGYSGYPLKAFWSEKVHLKSRGAGFCYIPVNNHAKRMMATMQIVEICDTQQRTKIAEDVLESLPQWFGIPEQTRKYIENSGSLPFFAATQGPTILGFVAMKQNSRYTAEVYVMGVLPHHHRQGVGKALIDYVTEWAKTSGYEFLMVKTLDESHPDVNYANTRKFYIGMGFRPLECLPELWGKQNPCLLMVKHIA